MTVPFEDPGEEFVPSSDDLNTARGKAEELGEAAQKLGLYMQGYKLGAAKDGDGNDVMVVIADFIPGEHAWSTIVQDPETAKVDEQFRTIEKVVGADRFDDYKTKLAEEYEEIDPVAGPVHPWPSGPCDSFTPDGRSDRCATCDHPEQPHYA